MKKSRVQHESKKGFEKEDQDLSSFPSSYFHLPCSLWCVVLCKRDIETEKERQKADPTSFHDYTLITIPPPSKYPTLLSKHKIKKLTQVPHTY